MWSDSNVLGRILLNFMINNTKKEEKIINYNGYEIHLNYWGEYCVMNPFNDGAMLSYNSGFKSEKLAKLFIDSLDNRLNKKDIEELASKFNR